MSTRPAQKHSWLYHRNRLFAWASFLLLFGASILFPNTLTTVLWFIPALAFNYLIWITYRAVHPKRMWFRRMIPSRPQINYPEVLFPSRDGLILSAWHLKGVNNTAIILVHGKDHDLESVVGDGAAACQTLLQRQLHCIQLFEFPFEGLPEAVATPGAYGVFQADRRRSRGCACVFHAPSFIVIAADGKRAARRKALRGARLPHGPPGVCLCSAGRADKG